MPKTRHFYERVNGAWPETVPPLTGPEAERAARRLYHRWRKKRWTGPLTLTSGNRYTWFRGGVFYVNPDRGWQGLVHDLSHYFFSESPEGMGRKPHDFRHAHYEREMIEYIVNHGWLDGKLKPKVKPPAPKPDAVTRRAERLAHAKTKLAAWEAKQRRALTHIRKWKRRISGLQRFVMNQMVVDNPTPSDI